jgi:phasin family protein
MINQVQDFVSEQMQAFAGRAQQLGADPLTSVREGATYSAEALQSLKRPVHVAARSGVQLSSLTHKTAQELIELQSRMVTTAIGEIAASLERAAQAQDFAALVTAQADALRASAERLVSDTNRAMEIFAASGRGMQQLANETYESVATTAMATAPRAVRTRAPRKAKAKSV